MEGSNKNFFGRLTGERPSPPWTPPGRLRTGRLQAAAPPGGAVALPGSAAAIAPSRRSHGTVPVQFRPSFGRVSGEFRLSFGRVSAESRPSCGRVSAESFF